MSRFLNTVIVFLMLSTNAYSAAGAQPDGGSEGSVSKYEKGHKLVLSAKYLEKKADKFFKKGNTKKAEKNLAWDKGYKSKKACINNFYKKFSIQGLWTDKEKQREEWASL